jgi:hypothetical protein
MKITRYRILASKGFVVFDSEFAAKRFFKSKLYPDQIDAYGIDKNGRWFRYCMMYKIGRKIKTQPRRYNFQLTRDK